MTVIQFTATSGADGRLRLDIPTGAAGASFDVAVVPHNAHVLNGTEHAIPMELMKTCGAIDDETFDAHHLADPPPSSD